MIDVQVPPDELPPTDDLLSALHGEVPDGFSIVLVTTYGEEVAVGTTGQFHRRELSRGARPGTASPRSGSVGHAHAG